MKEIWKKEFHSCFLCKTLSGHKQLQPQIWCLATIIEPLVYSPEMKQHIKKQGSAWVEEEQEGKWMGKRKGGNHLPQVNSGCLLEIPQQPSSHGADPGKESGKTRRSTRRTQWNSRAFRKQWTCWDVFQERHPCTPGKSHRSHQSKAGALDSISPCLHTSGNTHSQSALHIMRTRVRRLLSEFPKLHSKLQTLLALELYSN